jgi:hypothetical protein
MEIRQAYRNTDKNMPILPVTKSTFIDAGQKGFETFFYGPLLIQRERVVKGNPNIF